MKYLKTYEANRMYIGSKFANKKSATPDSKERLTKMLDTLDDMFLDCKDDGFKLDYSGNLLNIEITKPVNRGHNMYSNNWFKMSEISDTLHMIMSYLDTFSDMIELESIEINVRKPLGIQGPMIISKPIKREDIDKDIDLSNIHITYKELGI